MAVYLSRFFVCADCGSKADYTVTNDVGETLAHLCTACAMKSLQQGDASHDSVASSRDHADACCLMAELKGKQTSK